MSDQPLVSILMTAYNRQDYIAEAINSVLSSSFKDFELIILDDVSTDNTLNIARTFAEQDTRVKVYKNETNIGDYPNRNMAATYAKGKYLKYLDSDDYFLPDGLRYCVESMLENSEADWAMYCPLKSLPERVLSPQECIYSHFFKTPFLTIGPGGAIYKKEFFFNNGMFPTIYGPANDLYFNLLSASKGNLFLMRKEFFLLQAS